MFPVNQNFPNPYSLDPVWWHPVPARAPSGRVSPHLSRASLRADQPGVQLRLLFCCQSGISRGIFPLALTATLKQPTLCCCSGGLAMDPRNKIVLSGWSTILVALLLPFASLAVPQKPPQGKGQATAAPADAKKDQPLPLKPSRNIEFTTDQGTWLSVDVSPDGKTILFELLGDLYTVPFSGGEAHKLTSGMAFNSQPRYSPDGKKIAFISDRGGSENVCIADVDGSNPKQPQSGRRERIRLACLDARRQLCHRRALHAISHRRLRTLDVSHQGRSRRANHQVAHQGRHQSTSMGQHDGRLALERRPLSLLRFPPTPERFLQPDLPRFANHPPRSHNRR